MKKKSFRRLKKGFNILLGTLAFVILIGSAFAIENLFGIMFIIGFALSIYNKTLERKPSIPIFIFLGGIIIRISLSFIPSILESKTYFDLGISLFLFAILIFAGFRIKKGV